MAKLPDYIDYYARQNVDFLLSQPITDEDGNAVDLTGNTAKLAIREDADNAAVITLEVGSGLTLDILNSKITVSIPVSVLALVEARHYVYDWYRIDTSNIQHGITQGKFILNKAITV